MESKDTAKFEFQDFRMRYDRHGRGAFVSVGFSLNRPRGSKPHLNIQIISKHPDKNVEIHKIRNLDD